MPINTAITFGCWAIAASGQASAEPVNAVVKSLRRKFIPHIPAAGENVAQRYQIRTTKYGYWIRAMSALGQEMG
jgi:hypothetical protein